MRAADYARTLARLVRAAFVHATDTPEGITVDQRKLRRLYREITRLEDAGLSPDAIVREAAEWAIAHVGPGAAARIRRVVEGI
jgi:hypothetical protein